MIGALIGLSDNNNKIEKRSEAYYALIFNQLCVSIDTTELMVLLWRLCLLRQLLDNNIHIQSNYIVNEVTPRLLNTTSIAFEAAVQIGSGSLAKIRQATVRSIISKIKM